MTDKSNKKSIPTNKWLTVDEAPRDGAMVDLWIESGSEKSDHSMIDFYCADPQNIPGSSKRCGRVTNMQWLHKPPNASNWYPAGGLGYPLSPEVRPVYFMIVDTPAASS